MIELADTAPVVDIQPAEYNRLLGYPPGWTFEGRAQELADMAACWFVKNGRPWVYARQAESLQAVNGSIQIDGVSFHSPRLQSTLQRRSLLRHPGCGRRWSGIGARSAGALAG